MKKSTSIADFLTSKNITSFTVLPTIPGIKGKVFGRPFGYRKTKAGCLVKTFDQTKIEGSELVVPLSLKVYFDDKDKIFDEKKDCYVKRVSPYAKAMKALNLWAKENGLKVVAGGGGFGHDGNSYDIDLVVSQ